MKLLSIYQHLLLIITVVLVIQLVICDKNVNTTKILSTSKAILANRTDISLKSHVIFSEGGLSLDNINGSDKHSLHNASVQHSNNKQITLTGKSKIDEKINHEIINKTISQSIKQHSSITPRKGVVFNSSSITDTKIKLPEKNQTKFDKKPIQINITVTNSIPKSLKKPLITIGDDEPYAPSHFVLPKLKRPIPIIKTQIKTPFKNSSTTIKPIINDQMATVGKLHMSKVDTSPDYVVPIVLLILATPLIIGFVILGYRYGADWWDRRHYRRMDYLIEGIYNN